MESYIAMEQHRLRANTRKRWRNESQIRCRHPRKSPPAATSSWPSLLSMLAAAAMASSSPSSWVVRGQSTEQQNHHESSQLRAAAASTDTTMVRGGRGGAGRAFVRQHGSSKTNQQQRHRDVFADIDGDSDDNIDEGIDQTNDYGNKQANSSELSDLLLSKQKNRLEGNQMDGQNQQYEDFLLYCQDSLGIDVGLVEIDHFDYPNYLLAMEDRIDIFCDDCHDDDDDDDDWERNNSNDNESYNDEQKSNQNKNDTSEEKNAEKRNEKRRMPSLDDEVRYLSVTEEYPPVSVRGLKASRDIEVGEVVLSIPHAALWTIHNAIDASGDTDLVEAMGAASRQRHGWESPGMDEIPLLAVTLLYQMDKASAPPDSPSGSDIDGARYRPDHRPYLNILEQQIDKLEDMIPHLWSSRKLRKSATPSVRNVAKAIRKDVVELYESIVMVLIENHPSVFGKPQKRIKKPSTTDNSNPNGEDSADNEAIEEEEEIEREWMFSLEKFHWAYALVSSRHWHLNIPDDPTTSFLDHDDLIAEPRPPPVSSPDIELESDPKQDPGADSAPTDTDGDETHIDEDHEVFADQEGPPAATPTDEWVVIQDKKLIEEEEREMNRNEEGESGNTDKDGAVEAALPGESQKQDRIANGADNYEKEDNDWPEGNSFLAPLADLLNFGPPCTRGIYNHATMAFEIVATCEFRKGQEITFWYTDACEDVFMANYGFTMPMMVHKCTEEETQEINESDGDTGNNVSMAWQQQQQEHQQQYLEDELSLAYEELDRLDRRLEFMMQVLDDCHCGNQTELFEAIWADEDPRNHEHDNENHNHSDNDLKVDSPSTGLDADEKLDGAPLPSSPTPPKKEVSQTKPPNAGGGPDAVHAIRTNRNRGGSIKRGKSNNHGNKQMQHHRHQHHRHSMTRTRSRQHHGRRFEF